MSACCETCCFDPCQCCPPTFTRIGDLRRTLVGSLVPCVDQIRDLYTCLGARAYEVALIHTQWSGGQRGRGVEQVIREEVILPTPLISDLSALSSETHAIGNLEEGTVDISEISARYSEDFLVGKEAGGASTPRDLNFYWEIRLPGGQRRRFTVNSPPNLEPLKFQWTIRLVRAYEDRARNGDPRA